MKQTSQHIILFIAAVISLYALSLPSCSNLADRTVRDKLALVDTLLLSDPDAALDTLATLPDSIANPATAAWRNLLTVKARDKASRIQRDYSIEQRAYTYYIGAHDSLEYQSAYYFGSQLSFCKRNDSALIVLTDALDLSLELGDMFYAGMAARDLSNIYGNILVAPKELEYAIKSKQYFTEANRHEHAVWQDLMIISGLYLNDRYDEAIEVISNIDSAYINDDSFREILNDKKVTMYSIYNKYDNVIATYNEMIADNHKMTDHDWCLLANSLVSLGKWQEAETALANIGNNTLSKPDSVYYGLISARIFACKGDFKNAWQLAIDGGYALNSYSEDKLLKPETLLLSDYLSLKAKSKEKEAQLARKNTVLIIIFMSIVTIMLIALIITLYKKKKASESIFKLKEIAFMATVQDKDLMLNENKSKFDSERKELELTIDELNQLVAKIKNDSTANSDNIALINSICGIWFYYKNESTPNLSAEKRDQKFIKQFSKVLSKQINLRFIEHQVEIKDRGNGYPLSMLNMFLPRISNEDYKLLALSYIGFDAATIAALLERASTNSVYQSKHKIKNRILETNHPQAKQFINAIWGYID